MSQTQLPGARSLFARFGSHLNLRAGGRWIFLASILGVFIGLAAAIFQLSLDVAHRFLFEKPEAALGLSVGGGEAGWIAQIVFLLFIPAVGGACSAFLTSRYAPEATGHGTDALVRAYHRSAGRVRFRVAPLKLLASMLTLGTGGSAGREGPVAQFGGTLGSTLANLLGLDARTRRILLLSGAAGGIGAIFRAPLGGALFASEVIYRGPDFEGSAVFPSVVAAIVSYSTFAAILGKESLFRTPDLVFERPLELPFYILLALLCAAVGITYVWIFYRGEARFSRIPLSAPWRAGIAGIGLGALTVLGGFATGDDQLLLGGGYDLAQHAMDGSYVPLVLFLLAFAKILGTTCTISGGGSGGVFAPSLAIGACLGGAFGQAAIAVFPASAPDPTACALVGMAGFFAGVAKTPLTAVILISEMTGSYGLLVPLMLVSSIACLLSPGWSIYREQVRSRIDSPAHLGELASAALANIKVAEAIDPNLAVMVVRENATLDELAEAAAEHPRNSLVVLNNHGKLQGVVTLTDIQRALRRNDEIPVTARDLTRRAVPKVTPDVDLREAVNILVANREEDLLVVDPKDRYRPLAIISRQDLLSAYQRIFRREAD